MDTFVVIAIFIVALFILEFARVFSGRATISGQIWALRTRSPELGFLICLIAGALWAHFFWGQCGPF